MENDRSRPCLPRLVALVSVVVWLAALPSSGVLISSAEAATYYVDSASGSDDNSGTAEELAWKSLDKVNDTTFQPGDCVLFKAGTTYAGTLAPRGSGSKDAPIVLDTYGQGAKPRIDAEGKHDQALLLRNVEYWEVSNLELTNFGDERKPFRFGARVEVDDFGTAHHIHLNNLVVHDVNNVLGDERSPYGGVKVEKRGGGIVWMTLNADQAKPSRFDGLLIENCHVYRVDQDGIWGWAGHKDRGKWHPYDRRYWHPNLNVVVRDNLLEDIGGTGIVPRCCDGCILEHNTIRGAASRARAGETGIYVWSCDGTIIQLNEISGVTGKGADRVAIDSDFNSRGTVVQYNYTHDNLGGFGSVFTGRFSKRFHGGDWNIHNAGTIFRYNISQNDGWGKRYLFYHVEDAKNVQIYNNTFFVGKDLKLRAFSERLSEQYTVRNNLFFVEGELTFGQHVGDAAFDHNLLFGNISAPPSNPGGLTADPGLKAPGTGSDGRDTVLGYRLLPGSPCIGAGQLIPNNGGRDFWGNPVSATLAPDIGAHRFSGAAK